MRFEFLTVKNDLAAILYIRYRNNLHKCRFTGSIGADQTVYFASSYRKVHSIQCLNSWKQLIDLSHFQNVVTFLHYVLLLCLCLLMHQIFQVFI